MANFVPVLKKTIDGLAQNTPATRDKVYEKARRAFEAKLASISPAPSQAAVDRQKSMLEDAIREVEASYAPPSDPVDDSFTSIFNDFAPEPPVYDDTAEASARDVAQNPVEDTYRSERDYRAEPGFADQGADGLPDRDDDYDAPLGSVHNDDTQSDHGERDDRYDYADDRDESPAIAHAPRRRTKSASKKRKRGLVAGAVCLLLLIGAGSAFWFKGEEIASALGLSATTEVADDNATQGSDNPDAQSGSQSQAQPEAPKLTQRLNEDGSETDEGPAGGEQTVGEGTSVAEVSPPETQAESGQPANESGSPSNEAVAVGQRAIFYEERTNVAQGSAQAGSVVWSLVQESPGGEGPPEAAVRAEATIPDMDIQLRMTIRRNTDASLPASHIVEMIFLTPDGFAGGGIDRVLRVTMKDNEQAPGQALLGIPAKIADGFFLVALNDTEAERRVNLNLLRRDSWIDIPMIYKSGRRALITVEKGAAGEAIFQQALDAWDEAAPQNGN